MAKETTQIPVHATPKAAKNVVGEFKRDASGKWELNVRVTAPPEGGKANKAVCETLAKAIGVPKSRVRVIRGDTSRHKIVEIEDDTDKVSAWLESLPGYQG